MPMHDVVDLQRERYNEAQRVFYQASMRDEEERNYLREVAKREWKALEGMIEARALTADQDKRNEQSATWYDRRQACKHKEQAGPYMQCQHCETLTDFYGDDSGRDG